MSSSTVSLVLTIIAITIIPAIISLKIRGNVNEYSITDFKNEKFAVSKWLYVINYCSILVPLLFLGVSYYISVTQKIDWFSILFGVIGLAFLIVVIYNIYILPKMYVLFQNGIFIYFNGRKEKAKIILHNIRFLYVSQGSIVIDDGNKLRKVIPLYFEKSSKIVAMLKYYENKTKES